MFSSLDGLRHSTSCAISSNVNRQPPGTFARNLKELNVQVEASFSPVRFSYSNVDIDLNYINEYIDLARAKSEAPINKFIF